MKAVILLLLIGSWQPLFAQESVYIPLEFRKAYEANTRSKNGSVTQNYWQNRSSYDIRASVDPASKLLKGTAAIIYYNNSPDTLQSITFHSYHDYLKPYTSRNGFDGLLSQAADHKGMVIEKLMVAGENINIKNSARVKYGGTNYSIKLIPPLPPTDSLHLNIDWNFIIPDERQVRSGVYDSTSMFIGYWYPEIAVKDDIYGWDTKVFNASTEFYHDFSDYNISLTVPDHFTVWASVPPNNPDEVYSPLILRRLENARQTATPVKILSQEDFTADTGGTKTWKFTARDFPDFAFALSDHFLWDAATYYDEEGEYFIQTAYSHTTPGFNKILPTLATSMEILHTTFPRYPFPYKHFTVFHGQDNGGGMEFPGMANNALVIKEDYERYLGVEFTEEEIGIGNLNLSLHEMAHMYFPFMMGVNEKKYAWMDEGFAETSTAFLPDWMSMDEMDFSHIGSLSVVPVMVPSNEHDNSKVNTYLVGGAAFISLYDLLGEKAFFKGLHAFMDEWKYKHPTPYDMMFAFNRVTQQDLNWFWKKWFFDWGYIDLSISDVKDGNVYVVNEGGRPMTFSLMVTYENGDITEEKINPEIWKNSTTYLHPISINYPIKEVRIKFQHYPDAVRMNNFWPRE